MHGTGESCGHQLTQQHTNIKTYSRDCKNCNIVCNRMIFQTSAVQNFILLFYIHLCVDSNELHTDPALHTHFNAKVSNSDAIGSQARHVHLKNTS